MRVERRGWFYRLFVLKILKKISPIFASVKSISVGASNVLLVDSFKPEVRAYSKERGLPTVSCAIVKILSLIEEGCWLILLSNETILWRRMVRLSIIPGGWWGAIKVYIILRLDNGVTGVALGNARKPNAGKEVTIEIALVQEFFRTCVCSGSSLINSKSDASIRCLGVL